MTEDEQLSRMVSQWGGAENIALILKWAMEAANESPCGTLAMIAENRSMSRNVLCLAAWGLRFLLEAAKLQEAKANAATDTQ